MSEIAADQVVLVAVAWLLRITWYDFYNLKILNRDVLILLGIYAVWIAMTGFDTLLTDLVAGGLLFVISFSIWLAKALGAGDVKLYFGLGLFIGFELLPGFAILLLIVSLVFIIAILAASHSKAETGIVGRLREFRTSGKSPYAVPITAAAIPMMLFRAFG